MPIWCDMTCNEADWPQEDALDGSGSCRTFLAVYCKKYNRIHAKNAPCLDLSGGQSKKDAKPKTAASPAKFRKLK